MQTDPNISTFKDFCNLLDFISEKLHIDFEIKYDYVYFFLESYNTSNYLKDTDFIFSFHFDKYFNCSEFESEYRGVYVKDNNYTDFLLDCYNSLTRRHLNSNGKQKKYAP